MEEFGNFAEGHRAACVLTKYRDCGLNKLVFRRHLYFERPQEQRSNEVPLFGELRIGRQRLAVFEKLILHVVNGSVRLAERFQLLRTEGSADQISSESYRAQNVGELELSACGQRIDTFGHQRTKHNACLDVVLLAKSVQGFVLFVIQVYENDHGNFLFRV
ncbi:MAG: hypothetical protein EOM65_14465 [Synergistales bacterium]|nr:hypothetical protein [Synergistales bacterium]